MIHSSIRITMRTYGQHPLHLGGKRRASGTQRTELYSTREATEWDVRVDINELLTADAVVENIKQHLDELQYVLCSGVERPDLASSTAAFGNGKPAPTASNENHVHLCIVLQRPRKRGDVLQLVRGTRKMGDEYCAPRNARFAYAGWVIHHGKPKYKIEGEPLIRYEYGTLPMDAFTEEVANKIKGLLKKWGTPEMEQRFKGYVGLLGDPKIEMRKQLERKMALAAKLQNEIFELRLQVEIPQINI